MERTYLTAAPRRWYSNDYTIFAHGEPLVTIQGGWFREQGVFTLDNAAYTVRTERPGRLVLAQGDTVLARVTKVSFWKHQFVVEVNGSQYQLEATAAWQWRRSFVLRSSDTMLGTIAPQSPWNRNATIDLPEALSLPVRLFLVILVIFMWQRDEAATAAVVAGSS